MAALADFRYFMGCNFVNFVLPARFCSIAEDKLSCVLETFVDSFGSFTHFVYRISSLQNHSTKMNDASGCAEQTEDTVIAFDNT